MEPSSQDFAAPELAYQPDPYDLRVLLSCAHWARVLGICAMLAAGGLLLTGLSVIGGIFPFPPAEDRALYYGLALITSGGVIFLPGFYLNAFGKDAHLACESANGRGLAAAFENLRACLRFAGFLASLMLAALALGLLVLLIALYFFTPDVSGFRS